jgi:hypothetical protein
MVDLHNATKSLPSYYELLLITGRPEGRQAGHFYRRIKSSPSLHLYEKYSDGTGHRGHCADSTKLLKRSRPRSVSARS